ncbi:GGDEF domain-containing protein [Rhodoferax sp. PAMC 29310]|uniref:GGDEF domain-containing protein n=1 Tax=Rhodoferax sp. PAMC 29310 TaxID=2822760 RepID=UPI001B330EA6|nr:GGDEF domain-containing protein [Rhodoferax sp. PAMC 29310]
MGLFDTLRNSLSRKRGRTEPPRNGSATKNSLKASRKLLASTLNELKIGLEIWDANDRLVLYNKSVNHVLADFHIPDHIGQSYEALMRGNLRRHLIPAAIGCEDQWLTQHLAQRHNAGDAELQELAGDVWVNVQHTRPPDGYLISARVNVTDMVRRGKTLEATNQILTKQTSTDGLTGLANRRSFDQALDVEWQRASRAQLPLSLLMVDIDHFKNFNDHYGHLAGDECLRRVANALGDCVRRAGEMAVRYGGEEFVLLLPGADDAHACETAQKCLDRLRREAMPHAASPTAKNVTISIGVATVVPSSGTNAKLLVNTADAAMYRAKTGGRARYESASQEDWDIDPDTPRSRPVPLS